MQTVMMPNEVEEVGTGTPAEATPVRRTTTLYALIAALQDLVDPEDDGLVVATVVHLLRSRRLRWTVDGKSVQCGGSAERDRRRLYHSGTPGATGRPRRQPVVRTQGTQTAEERDVWELCS
jgi:hypothetical protein